MVLILASAGRTSYFQNLVERNSRYLMIIDEIVIHEFDNDEAIVQGKISDKPPKLILFDNDFSKHDFKILWKAVMKTVKTSQGNIPIGMFQPQYFRHEKPNGSEIVAVEKFEELGRFT